MKATGITRRVDDLGRIVIPKEIRKSMHLKSGELLEIMFNNNSDSLILKKHSLIDDKDNLLKTFILTLSSSLNSDVFITDLNKIIFSNIETCIDQKLSNYIESMIVKNNFIFNNKFSLTDKLKLDNKYKIFPISPNGDMCGLIILSSNINDEILKFTIKFLTNYFEIM